MTVKEKNDYTISDKDGVEVIEITAKKPNVIITLPSLKWKKIKNGEDSQIIWKTYKAPIRTIAINYKNIRI